MVVVLVTLRVSEPESNTLFALALKIRILILFVMHVKKFCQNSVGP